MERKRRTNLVCIDQLAIIKKEADVGHAGKIYTTKEFVSPLCHRESLLLACLSALLLYMRYKLSF